MNFKKPIEQVAQDAAYEAFNKASSMIGNTAYTPPGQLGQNISMAIQEGVKAALLSMMQQVYTDAQFEEDIKLR
jgi:hypothetical protein